MDLRDQLQQHLGSAYTIDRELGGGGMSRVFVARDTRLERTVVIKVLSPELAQGLNADRFEREIKLAASLQQANIVPVLVAGDVGGLPYFTMPFVEGESLRQRLAQGPVPVSEAVGILRDVARALAYAHARGVVHRDIKPDNVLLSGGAAVVTDFGIAKAISASRTAAPGATLTQLGTSIGTPAYMAPEQVAGDPNLDHRVDLYALGCTAFELLTGQQPFANRTPQRMLAAHLSESVPVATALRPDTPPALAALIQRLMAKDPADRPSSAAEVVQSLDQAVTSSAPTLAFSPAGMFKRAILLYLVAVLIVLLCTKAAIIVIGLPDWVFPGAVILMALGLPALLITAYVQRVARHVATATPTLTPGGTMAPRAASGTMATMALKASPHLTWRRTWRGGAWAVGAFAVVVAVFMVMRALGIGFAGSLFAKGQLAADDRIVLADFTASQADSALAPILGAAVRAAMSQSNSIRLVDQAEIAQVLQQMKRNRDTPLTPDLAREVAQRAGAKAVLGGRLAPVGSGYAISLDLTGADRGVALASFQGTADGVNALLPTVDHLTRELRGKIGESLRQVQHSIPLQQATTTSLDALKKYSEAAVANDVDGDYDRAATLARQAVGYDSTFALAWRKLAVALKNGSGSSAAEDSAVKKTFQYADRLPDREKYLAIGAYYQKSVSAGDRGKAVAAYQAAYAADTTGTIAPNNLAILFSQRGQYDSAWRYARRERELEHSAISVDVLIEGYDLIGHPDSAKALFDSLLTHSPDAAGMAMTQIVRYETYLARDQQDSALNYVRHLAATDAPSDQVWALGFLASEQLVAGRLADAAVSNDAQMKVAASRGAGTQFDQLSQAAVDIAYRGEPGEGVALLDAMVAGPQWSAAAPDQRPYIMVSELYAMAKRPDRARTLLSRYDAESPGAKAPDAASGRAEALGDVALAEGKSADAIHLFYAADTAEDGEPVGCGACTQYNLGRAFDAAGQADSAITHFASYLAIPRARRMAIDFLALAAVHKRLAELYDNRHDTKRAIEQYTAFVDQWKNADPVLQPTVAQARQRIAELTTAEGH
jgi:tetratricopeptide (TPR) repeat protein